MRNIFIDSHPPSDEMIFMKEESTNTEEISNASMIQKCKFPAVFMRVSTKLVPVISCYLVQ